MGKGRKPISNALKVLKGTDQPCRMREEISYEKITKIRKLRIICVLPVKGI